MVPIKYSCVPCRGLCRYDETRLHLLQDARAIHSEFGDDLGTRVLRVEAVLNALEIVEVLARASVGRRRFVIRSVPVLELRRRQEEVVDDRSEVEAALSLTYRRGVSICDVFCGGEGGMGRGEGSMELKT